jgi:hypothetical protein
MGFAVIEEHYQMTGNLAQQMLEECYYFFAFDVVLIQLAVQRTMKSFRADSDAGDSGDTIVTIPMMKNRRLAYRAPGFAD